MNDSAVRSASLVGALSTSLLASVCCVGPVLLALLGLGGAGLLVQLEPMQPYLMAVTFGLLALAFARTYRRKPASVGATEVVCDCERPRTGRAALWIATGLALLLLASPYLLPYLLP